MPTSFDSLFSTSCHADCGRGRRAPEPTLRACTLVHRVPRRETSLPQSLSTLGQSLHLCNFIVSMHPQTWDIVGFVPKCIRFSNNEGHLIVWSGLPKQTNKSNNNKHIAAQDQVFPLTIERRSPGRRTCCVAPKIANTVE